MSKNLVLVQNGFPGSQTSGTEVEALDIRNFFRYEKSIVPTTYARTYVYGYKTYGPDYNIAKSYYEDITGEIKPNSEFKHYSISFLLFAVRMKKGFVGTNALITSRLNRDDLKLRFLDVGNTVEAFKALSKEPYNTDGALDTYNFSHKTLSDTITVASVDNKNYCFFAVLFSDSVYLQPSGTELLVNEPLFNISWTESEFITETEAGTAANTGGEAAGE